MNQSLQQFLARITPYLTLGVLIVLGVIGFIFLSYILIIGIAIGLVIYAVSMIRRIFFPPKQPRVARYTRSEQKQSQGRIIEHDDIK